jgi:hypothetical protein
VTVGPSAVPGIPQDVTDMLQKKLDRLQAQNGEDLKALQAQGVGFDQGQLINGRIDTVIAAVAQAMGPQGPVWGLQCRLLFEEQLAENLATAKQ